MHWGRQKQTIPIIIIHRRYYFGNVNFSARVSRFSGNQASLVHISMNTAHSGCEPSRFMLSFTHFLRVFLPQHHLSPQSSPRFYNTYPILSSITLQMPKPSQSTMPYHLSHTLNTQNTVQNQNLYASLPYLCRRSAVGLYRISESLAGYLVSGRYPESGIR